MKKFILIAGVAAVTTALALAEGPVFGKFRQSYSGAVVSFIGGSGTNTAIEVVYDGDTPFRLAEVTATVDGVAVGTTTVSRVWQFHRDAYKVVVSTNFFGTVETNKYVQTDAVVVVTNQVYSSATDTLPGSRHFVGGDLMVVDFGEQTNVIVRILGTAQ
jgi:hypothetical protein